MLPNSGLISMHDILVEMGYDPSLPMDLRLRKVNDRKQVWINSDWRNLNMCSPKTPKDTPPFNLMDWYEYDHLTKENCCAFIENFDNNSRGWYSANISSVTFSNGIVQLSGLGTNEPRFGLNSVSPNPGISFNPRDYNYIVVRMRAAVDTGGTQGIFFFGAPEIGGTFVSRPYSIGTNFADYIFDFSTTAAWADQGTIRNFAIGLPNNGPDIFIESFRICNKEDLPVYTPVRIVADLSGPNIVGTGDDYQYNLVVQNTGSTATTGTTTIKIFFNPTSGITYRTTTASGWTYSFSSGVLTITTSNVLSPGFSANLPILVTGTTQGTYQISGKLWTAGDPVASTESTARDTNQIQTVVTDNPPCVALSNLQMNGDSLVNQGSQNGYSVNYSGSTRGITFNWTIESGTGVTITSGQGTGAIVASFNFSSKTSSVVLRCTITNLCSTQFVDISISPRLFGNTSQSRGYTSQQCSPTQIPGTWVLTVPEGTYTDFTVNEANNQAITYLNSTEAQGVAESQMAANGVQCFASCNDISSVDAVLRLNGSVVPFSNVEFGVTYEILASVSGGSNVSYNWFFDGITPINIVGASAFVQFNFNDRGVPSNGGSSYDNASFTVVATNGCNSSSATKIQTVTPLLYSASDTRTYVKTNCPNGQEPVGSITDTLTYFAVTQSRANEGIQILINNRQALANTQLSCQSVNVGNDVQSGTFQRNDCGSCATSVGSVSYTVPANTYFAPTKDQANALAFNDLQTNGQIMVNSELGCSTNQSLVYTGPFTQSQGGQFFVAGNQGNQPIPLFYSIQGCQLTNLSSIILGININNPTSPVVVNIDTYSGSGTFTAFIPFTLTSNSGVTNQDVETSFTVYNLADVSVRFFRASPSDQYYNRVIVSRPLYMNAPMDIFLSKSSDGIPIAFFAFGNNQQSFTQDINTGIHNFIPSQSIEYRLSARMPGLFTSGFHNGTFSESPFGF